jgi:hypothetical protein
VALQGTIETFALPDVMRLLASTKKTGCLRLTGSRGDGSVWVDSGTIVASEASGANHATSAVEVFFELLRFKDGDFVFDSDVTPESPGDPADVEPVLDQAEKMLDEWKLIEAVVPSLDAWVTLTPELSVDEITVDQARWRLLVAIGAGTTVGRLGDQLELAELAISRSVKDLVESDLASIGDAPAEVATPAPLTEPAHVPSDVTPTWEPPVEAAPAAAAPSFDTNVDAPPLRLADSGTNGSDRFERESYVLNEQPNGFEPSAEPVPVGGGFEPEPSDAAEIARQLANLSPKAAKAVAAAAKATTVEEREAALAEVDDDQDPINRELLIKFLGSVS